MAVLCMLHARPVCAVLHFCNDELCCASCSPAGAWLLSRLYTGKGAARQLRHIHAVGTAVSHLAFWPCEARLHVGPVVDCCDGGLLQVAYNPQVLLPASKLGENSEVFVQDAAALANPEESLSFWQLQVLASHLQNALL